MKNNRLFIWALTSALAGFLFGFDTVVISGAEQKIQELWGLDSQLHGLAISAALWGTVLGSLVGGVPTDILGRKKTLFSIGILYLVSALWSALAGDVYAFMMARFIGGVGIGISTVAAPLYISEISPPDRRGFLAGMFQFNIVFGILIALVSNYVIGISCGENGWRWMLGAEAVPAVIYTALCLTIPQSPRWLIVKRNEVARGREILKQIVSSHDDDEVDALVTQIQTSASGGADPAAAKTPFFSSRLRIPILLAFLVAFFNQLSGINAVLYFAPRIFQLAGLGANAALLNSVGIGITNLIFTLVGLYLIDRLGRRSLLYVGSIGYILSLGLCAYTFFVYAPQFEVANSAISLQGGIEKLAAAENLTVKNDADIERLTAELNSAKKNLAAATSAESYQGSEFRPTVQTGIELESLAANALKEASEESSGGGFMVLLCIFAFIASHAVGQGAVIWVFISEIFPNEHRATGTALGCFTHWIFAAALTMIFPWMISTFAPGYVFGFFCFMMCLQLLWVGVMVPETKGVSLEEVQQRLQPNAQ